MYSQEKSTSVGSAPNPNNSLVPAFHNRRLPLPAALLAFVLVLGTAFLVVMHIQAKPFVGLWERTYTDSDGMPYIGLWQFNSDGTGYFSQIQASISDKPPMPDVDFKWEKDGDYINIQRLDGNSMPPVIERHFWSVSADNKTLSLSSSVDNEGIINEFRRQEHGYSANPYSETP